MIYTCDSQNVLPGPAEMVSPGHLLEMQVVGTHLKTYLIKNLGWGPAVYILTSPPPSDLMHAQV